MAMLPPKHPFVRAVLRIINVSGLFVIGSIVALFLDALGYIYLSDNEEFSIGFVSICLIVLITIFGLAAKPK